MPDLAVRRTAHFALTMSTAAAGTARLWQIFRVDGPSGLEMLLLALFAVLFAWIASSFWLCCFGAYARSRGFADKPPAARCPSGRCRHSSDTRTAILIPIHNEEPESVFAGVRAVCESVRAAGVLDGFDFFVLSDSTDPEAWIAEELEWCRLRRDAVPGARVFYRHRSDNCGRKSGNIADFCRNWGTLYDYMVVLDADSLMTGEALSRLVRLMDANPRAALIQLAPLPVGRDSLFARMQQFAASVYGPVYMAGLSYLQGPDGNYWGHNAIIRVRPFMRHCGLPKLPGRGPLGGEILSHDFVEAALLRRAGWELWLAPDLEGSYEEPPPTLLDHLKRDRRWCQGNLQHMRLILARGFRLPSRLHLANGVMTYLSSPLWLLMLVVSAVEAYRMEHVPAVTYVGAYPVLTWPVPHALAFLTLVLVTMVLLYGPKLLAYVLLLVDRDALNRHGGSRRVALGMLTEILLSTLLAPVVMLTHSGFVVSVLLGRGASWGRQERREHGVSFAAAARAFAPHTLIALGAGVAAWYFIPRTLPWFLPVLAGLALAVPLCQLTSAARLGRAARRRGLFLVPSERRGLPVLDRARALAETGTTRRNDAPGLLSAIRRVFADPVMVGVHLALLGGARAPEPDRARLSCLAAAAAAGDGALSAGDWRALLSDTASVSALAARTARSHHG
ncbi:MAG TPA: glucans biosynthesis glucosyltransferase MdoH [Stellaceae bacterium]|nr:glucans biosynthesis glucosyltransferase MdoH [Stellaceae bacterium]